jgi:hypothetical protein
MKPEASRCRVIVTAITLLTAMFSVRAANIAFVSDANDPLAGAGDANTFRGFFPAGSGYSDSGFVTILQNAGHNVIRFNQPNAPAQLLTEAEITALNTNDLVIISKTVNSGAYQQGQGDQWNTRITAPLIDCTVYHARNNRLGWFASNEGPDGTPAVLSAMLSGDPANDAVIDYLFGGVAMNGTNTAYPYDEFLDRNTSHISGAPVTGGIVYSTTTYVREDGNVTPAFGYVMVGFPAGTAVRFGTNILAGYRMLFVAGTRESGAAPGNNVGLNAGRENLSPTGENIYLRAVEVALRNGAAPPTDPSAPIVFTTQPANTTVLQGVTTVTFSVSVTGAASRTLQWQRDTGDGVTFTNIPGASTPFLASALTLTNVSLSDSGARFQVQAINTNGTVLSDVATLTVRADTQPPVALSAASLDGNSVGICFDELLDNDPVMDSAQDEFNYLVDDGSGPVVPQLATLRADGKSVLLTLAVPVGPKFTVHIGDVRDRWNNPMPGVDLAGINHGMTNIPIGGPNPVGDSFTCASNRFEITAGGLDLQNATDQFQWLYRSVEGDFDARARVVSMVSSNPLQSIESTAKAILTARATTDPNSVAVNVYVTPAYPADNSVLATYRAAAGGGTTTNGAAFVPGGPPNGWIRLMRAGNVFTTYRSADGNTWTQLASTSAPSFGSTALVGIGANSRRTGRLAIATFSNVRIIKSARLVNSSYGAGNFSASFQSEVSVAYQVQYTTDLNAPSWTTLTTLAGDGALMSFVDSTAGGQSRFYRLVAN